MTAELSLLTATAATIAFVHTLMGPDHYVPFVGMAKANRWTLRRTLLVTLVCGVGHILGSIALGFVGVAIQAQVSTLEIIEGFRGDLAAWALLSFGIVYAAWGIRRGWQDRPHTHWHWHGLRPHRHVHQHEERHEHGDGAGSAGSTVTPWVIFVIFVFGPCEPLILLLMYPAAKESTAGLVMVTGIFGLVTVLTMLFAVGVSYLALSRIRIPSFARYGHAIAGIAIALCGGSVLFLGL
ncbi:MAG: hypothetical protein AAGE01_23620 [Pseudomonadota bacterium]